MYKKIVLYYSILFFSIAPAHFSQSLKFAWLSDPRIGAQGSEDALMTVVAQINKGEQPAFVLISGNCSENGKTAELSRAKEILDGLTAKYYIVPGCLDDRISESFGTAFKQIFGDDKFCIEQKSIKIIGMNSGPLWAFGKGHFCPEDVAWLDSVVMNSPSHQKLLFLSNQSLNGGVDNWYTAYNILRKGNIRCLLSGNSAKNDDRTVNGIPEYVTSAIQASGSTPAYSLVTVSKDSLFVSSVFSDGSMNDRPALSLADKYATAQVDTTEFDNYYGDLVWMKELNHSVNACPVVANMKIYLPANNGDLFCYNRDGSLAWKAQARAPISGRVAVAQGVVVTATTDGDIIIYDAENGRVIQSTGTNEKLTSTPVIFKTTYRGDETYGVLVGCASGKMLCFELSSLNEIWENNYATGLIQSVPVIENDRILYGSRDGSLYCVDAATGALNWKWGDSKSSVNAPAACIPQVGDGCVYVVTPDHLLCKIDLLLGKSIWRKKEFDAWESLGMSADKQKLYVKSALNKFFIVSAFDGKKLKEYDLKSGADYAAIEPRELNGEVITASGNGYLWELSMLGPKKIFYMGSARITGLAQTGDNAFIVSNVDGKLVYFTLPGGENE